MLYLAILSFLYTVQCANYNRFDATTMYPIYTTSNIYKQYPYKTDYPISDIGRFPNEATRYNSDLSRYNNPNYNTGYANNYNNYNTGQGNLYYQNGLSTPRYGEGYSSYEFPFMKNQRDYCVNRTPQNGIYVESLMGIWYGVEYIYHLAGDSRVDRSPTCIVIHIAEPVDQPSTDNVLYHVQHINAKFRHEYRHLRLLWDESGRTIEYSLYFRNDSSGYWQVFDGQNGTLTTYNTYQQFSGTVQVLKAVSDHLLLNFCQDPRDGRQAQLYSVLFSREPGSMKSWEIESIHTMLQNKRLSVASRRMVCGNHGFKIEYSLVFTILTCIMAYTIGDA